MSLPQNLLALCETMLPGENQRGRPDAATLKRCISTAYYAVFSLLVHAASSMLAGNSAGRKELRGYVARAFSHNEMAEACKGFADGNLNKGLRPCLQSAISTDLKDIAATFRSLQQSRHDADYNILKSLKRQMHAKPFKMPNGSSNPGIKSRVLMRHVFSFWRCL